MVLATLRATLGLFERIMRELWISGVIGGVLGGLVVVIALVLAGVIRLAAAEPAEVPSPPERRRGRSKRRPAKRRPAKRGS